MSDYVILKEVALGAEHKPTGRTRHYSGEQEIPTPSLLKIAKYEDAEGFYLLYCAADGTELTDTFHETLESAVSQAEWEFGIRPNEWQTHMRS